MRRFDDYKCAICGTEFEDCFGDETCCGATVVKDWSKLNTRAFPKETWDRSGTHDTQGRKLRATVKDSPRCKELLQDPFRSSFSDEQRAYYAGKLMVDGDSWKLRREMLSADAKASNAPDNYTGRE